MTCACALANKGYEVSVFEKHWTYGGYCQNFRRKGYRFGAAVHRVGGIYGKINIDNIMKALGIEEELQWYHFKEYVQVGDIRIDMCNENIGDKLKELFPEDTLCIDRFLGEIDRINTLLNLIDEGANQGIDKFSLEDLRILGKYRRMSIDAFLREIFSNEEIVSILVAVTDAMPGGSVFAFTRMIAFANCGDATYNPVGGAERIVELLADRIKELGGEIRLNSPVDTILVENGRAVGVTCKGESYRADYLISNCDFQFTVKTLVGEAYINPRLLDWVNHKWEESPSCMCVWLGLDTDLNALGYEPVNFSYYPQKESVLEDKRKLIGKGSLQRENDFILVSLSSNLDAKANPEGKGQMMLGMLVNWDFEGLSELSILEQKEAYRAGKRKIAKKLIEKAEQFYPQLHEHIEVMEIASPVTFQRFTGNSKGAFGGYKCTPSLVEDYSKIDGKQLIPGLFLTGHWGGVGDGVIFTTDVALRIADKVIRSDKREDFYDFNKNFPVEI